MKMLDLSVLPVDLRAGQCMQVVDRKGELHIIECEKVEIGNCLCDGCFFNSFELTGDICKNVSCAKRERETKDDVRYKEVEFEVVTDRNIDRVSDMPVGTKFIYKNLKGDLFKAEVKEYKGQNNRSCTNCALLNESCSIRLCMPNDRPDRKNVYFPYKEIQ